MNVKIKNLLAKIWPAKFDQARTEGARMAGKNRGNRKLPDFDHIIHSKSNFAVRNS